MSAALALLVLAAAPLAALVLSSMVLHAALETRDYGVLSDLIWALYRTPTKVIALAALAYFAPVLVAVARGHPQRGSILVLDLFLGWTLLGWVVTLAMAVSHVERKPPAQ